MLYCQIYHYSMIGYGDLIGIFYQGRLMWLKVVSAYMYCIYVPREKPLSVLSFVCFKISVAKDCKSKAMAPVS